MLFTQLKQRAKLAMALSVLTLTVAGQDVYAANKFSHTKVISHGESSGGKGKDTLTLTAPKGLNSSSCAAFVDATIEYKKRRFGEAKVAAKPAKGCNPAKKACKLTIDWRHAPAGRLNYRIKTNWEIKTTGC